MAEKTYTQEEHDALLAKVSDLETQVTSLSAASTAAEIDAKVAAAVAELQDKITDLSSQLDAATQEAETVKNDRDAIVAYLAGEQKAADEAAELASRKDARVAQVKEVASFTDEYVDANADRFAAMSDETFEAAIADWKAIAEKASAPAPKAAGEIPDKTAMTAARTTTDGENPLRDVLGLRFQGVDPRTV